MPELGGNALDEPLPDALDVVVDAVVAQDRKLLLDLARRFAAGLHVFLTLYLFSGATIFVWPKTSETDVNSATTVAAARVDVMVD